MKNNKFNAVNIALAGAVGVIGAGALSSDVNPFNQQDLSDGYNNKNTTLLGKIAIGEGKCGESKAKDEKHAEGKCGEGKCGETKSKDEKHAEGKCGESHAKDDKNAEGKCGEHKAKDDKNAEGKCGEGKCGEGKCGH
ncbi:HvfA family oxazolone/thioamide-modified RiPP metallophore [Marinicella gelatinilytica]|uniref:HvfA family oxazolone/thioamide-modified RiPP metallophore n=1 Tax=Marinicella gelatinilytica TaxID=2996017 RepID=UPI002260F798|nr:hypothetical protein [Marinicella gelatinilytica]MCX7543991.1 hypothetical protein [Marinicella gelatinilytica]